MRVIRAATVGCLVGACLSVASPARATAQAGDLLRIDGKEYEIFSNPLEPFLVLNPDKRPNSEIVSTGLWRGYLATWKIECNRLTVTKVEVLHQKPSDDDTFETEYGDATDAVFPGQRDVFAEWFTGHIVIPTGKLVKYVHMGYASIYKKYLLLRVERGVVTKQWRLNRAAFQKFRDAQFAAFSRTEKYQKEFEEMKKVGKRTDEEVETFLAEYYSEDYLTTIVDDDSSGLPSSDRAKCK